MRRVLVTGMSGTGKSTLLVALRSRGIACVDLDDDGVIVQPDGSQLWDEPRVRELLDDPVVDRMVLAGCEENMVGFLPDFDLVVLLTVPKDVLIERLATRTTNDFGRSPDQLAKILDDLAVVEPLLRTVADVEIDTRGSVDEVAARVLHAAGWD